METILLSGIVGLAILFLWGRQGSSASRRMASHHASPQESRRDELENNVDFLRKRVCLLESQVDAYENAVRHLLEELWVTQGEINHLLQIRDHQLSYKWSPPRRWHA